MDATGRKISQKEMKKILAWFKETPSPNEGRLKELKEIIAKGNYPSRKIVDAVAQQLVLRFQKRNNCL